MAERWVIRFEIEDDPTVDLSVAERVAAASNGCLRVLINDHDIWPVAWSTEKVQDGGSTEHRPLALPKEQGEHATCAVCGEVWPCAASREQAPYGGSDG